MARTKTHDKLLAKRRELNARKANGDDVRDEIRANEKLIRDSRAAGNRASDATTNAAPARKRAKAPAKVLEETPARTRAKVLEFDEPKPTTKRTRKAAPKPDETPEPPKSRKRKAAPVVESTTHTDADITPEPTPDTTTKVDDRPADVIAAEAAWRDSRGPDGSPAHGSAYTMLKYAELEVIRLNHAIAKLKKQVMRDPQATGITL